MEYLYWLKLANCSSSPMFTSNVCFLRPISIRIQSQQGRHFDKFAIITWNWNGRLEYKNSTHSAVDSLVYISVFVNSDQIFPYNFGGFLYVEDVAKYFCGVFVRISRCVLNNTVSDSKFSIFFVRIIFSGNLLPFFSIFWFKSAEKLIISLFFMNYISGSELNTEDA